MLRKLIHELSHRSRLSSRTLLCACSTGHCDVSLSDQSGRSRTELVEHLYDQDFDRDSNTIEVFIGRLRKKIGKGMLRTVRGLGYYIGEPEETS